MGWDAETPDGGLFDLIFDKSHDQIIWGANYFPQFIPPSMGWLFWDKGQRIAQSDGELAFTSFQKALRVYTLNRVELMKDVAEHPTQKPIRLITWCLTQAPEPYSTVLDPFMGSGTTGVACAQMGKAFTGIERERKYFDIACRRIEQAQAQGQLIPFEQPKQEQAILL